MQHGHVRHPPPGGLPQPIGRNGQQQLRPHQRWRQGLRQAKEKHPDVRAFRETVIFWFDFFLILSMKSQPLNALQFVLFSIFQSRKPEKRKETTTCEQKSTRKTTQINAELALHLLFHILTGKERTFCYRYSSCYFILFFSFAFGK